MEPVDEKLEDSMKAKPVLTCVVLAAALMVVTMGIRAAAAPPVAGSATLGVSTEELRMVALGWSAKKDVVGSRCTTMPANQRIGKVDDVIITPDQSVSFAIIGTGGFLGVG